MKGMLTYLSPFAPDQSGACGVLFELGGLIVIMDAGGCTGNICGFDEPRWFETRSAIVSAGLRDMDAILGRDEQLIQKLERAVGQLPVKFIAFVGTPVPAVIATDYHALVKMAEKRCHLPAIYVECNGTKLYEEGEEAAYLAVMKKFAGKETGKEHACGILGATPLGSSYVKLPQSMVKDRVCYGMGSTLEDIMSCGLAKKMIVAAASGLKAAKYLEQQFQIPYEVSYPFLSNNLLKRLKKVKGKRILIIHQQVMANEIRKMLRQISDAEITVATWFLLSDELREVQDISLSTEQQFADIVEKNQYDTIIGDKRFLRVLKSYDKEYIEAAHFAVSGVLEHEG